MDIWGTLIGLTWEWWFQSYYPQRVNAKLLFLGASVATLSCREHQGPALLLKECFAVFAFSSFQQLLWTELLAPFIEKS